MPFQPERAKKTKVSRSLYISEELVEKVEQLAMAQNTSFNSMVVTMIEYCLKETEEKK